MSEDKIIRHFKNLQFTVVATPKEYCVEYVIYDHEGEDTDGNILFHRKGSDHSPDPVDTVEESEPYISGSVKWDGCSNWEFDEQNRVMLHGCCRDDIVRFGLILGECFDLTKDLIVTFCDD